MDDIALQFQRDEFNGHISKWVEIYDPKIAAVFNREPALKELIFSYEEVDVRFRRKK